MNGNISKYQKALNNLSKRFEEMPNEDYKALYCEDFDALQELNEKYEKICLELQNASFMDDQCKLITLDIIKGIIKG